MEILTDLQKKVLLQFSELPDKETFYLTGGTALSAIFLKHRRSHDLDFFTHTEELIQPVSQKLEASLIKEGLKVKRSRAFHSFVELSVSYENESTVVHFASGLGFRHPSPSSSQLFEFFSSLP